MSRHVMTETAHDCWKCGGKLNLLTPDIQGWKYHCPACQHLTSPRHELERAMQEKPSGSVGIVSAVACKIDVVGPSKGGDS